MRLRIFGPMSGDYLLIANDDTCWICGQRLLVGQRTALRPFETPDQTGSLTVEARVCHATCAYRGERVDTPKGERIVDRIKDGDCGPQIVVTTDGQQWREEEIDL